MSLTSILDAMTTLQPGRARRVSSNEQPNWNDGNFDFTVLHPGEVLELPVLNGPGVITHIWLTSHAGLRNELDSLSLRIYWDGQDRPAVEAPLGLFFGVGQGTPAALESLPVQVSPTGSLTCFWRMPFFKSARIVIRNDHAEHVNGLYWQVDWVELESLPPDTPRFHAQYRQELPAVMGRDYLVADLEGRGHYVGTTLAVTNAQDGWFGEGDDCFYIDGEQVPSLQGTGTEDYFNDAWTFRTRTGIWFGQPRWEGSRAGGGGVCYRWHLLDPVPFSQSLRLTFEHKGNWPGSARGWYLERPDYWSSVAYWYQTGTAKRFSELPPWPERGVPWRSILLAKLLRQVRQPNRAGVAVRCRGEFGFRPALLWSGQKVGETLALPMEVTEEGRCALRLAVFPGGGRFSILLDDRMVLADRTFTRDGPEEIDLNLGVHELKPGRHVLAVRADDPAPLALEQIRMLKLPPEARRSVKTVNEAHFYRLAIGRSAYAYRLAYDRLPESLTVLVSEGLLEELYLNDENGFKLESSVQDGYFVVRSTAPSGWTHRWQGLDSRH